MEIIAYVAGVNSYDNYIALSSAQKDAEAISELFKELDYKVYTSIDDTYSDALAVLNAFQEDLYQHQYEGAIFYFAGHGAQIMYDQYLLFKDTPKPTGALAKNLTDNSVKLADVINDMRIKQDRHINIIMLDCCRDGRGAGQADLSLHEIPYQTLIAYATTAGDKACTNVQTNHGYFTESFLNNYSDKKDVEEIFRAVRKDIYNGCGKLSWVHTCLICNVTLTKAKEACFLDKPYCRDAYYDWDYNSVSVNINDAFTKLRSHNYYSQKVGVSLFKKHIADASPDDLFVYGRNLLQAAIGGCFVAQSELKEESLKAYAQYNTNHVLNGILHELYFNRSNELRKKIKSLRRAAVLSTLLQKGDFANSKIYIKETLDKICGCKLFRVDNPTYISIIINLKDTFTENAVGLHVYQIQNILFKDKDILNLIPWYGSKTKRDVANALENFLQIPTEYISIRGTKIKESDVIIK